MYRSFIEAVQDKKVLKDGNIYVDLQPGNGTRYPIIIGMDGIPGFGGIQVTLMWHFRGWRSYCFHSKPDIGYLAEKWNLDSKERRGDLEAILHYWDDLMVLAPGWKPR